MWDCCVQVSFILFDFLGLYCNRTWDGWLCWDDTPAGTVATQNCPDYFPDFDTTGRMLVILGKCFTLGHREGESSVRYF